MCKQVLLNNGSDDEADNFSPPPHNVNWLLINDRNKCMLYMTRNGNIETLIQFKGLSLLGLLLQSGP